ncbi:MAG: arginine-ornithine antiporter [Chloroflexi bacterium]|nr:arginine-ornithine antiporter [Chloroflexota bacterium]
MNKEEKLGLGSLTALVVGSMIGGGIFALPQNMARDSSVGAILIGWLITGIGMLALAFVYQKLSIRKENLTGGVYSYAKEGFGDFIGFNSAWGYWISAWLGNVSYAVLLFGALSYFFPIFESGNNIYSIAAASVFVWIINYLICKGVKDAALVNVVTTISKLIPIILFIILVIFAFNYQKFTFDFFGGQNDSLGGIMEQVKSTMLVTLWVFIGVEGAVVISGRAKNKRDVGKATIIGLVSALLIYVSVSVFSFGILSQAELAELKNPSMAYVLEAVVGSWGAIVINIGLAISLLGAFLGWTLLSAEIPYIAAKDGVLPKTFMKENKSNAPVNSLIITNGLIQVFLIITLFSSSTYETLLSIATTAILLPYLFSSLYLLKLTFTKETYENENKQRMKDMFISGLSALYGVWLIYAAGLDYLLMVSILYAFGVPFFMWAKKENQKQIFTGKESAFAVFLVVCCLSAFYLMSNGTISPL